MTKPPLGTGQRFRSLEHELATRGGAKDPAALAAAIGRRKLGGLKMQHLSNSGRRRGS